MDSDVTAPAREFFVMAIPPQVHNSDSTLLHSLPKQSRWVRVRPRPTSCYSFILVCSTSANNDLSSALP
ncbi:hypothetical protein C8Q78DRAFT_73708 [Trametes maxima]|nr:hypothetical protein C8Q78DRAFT_73708 [Trametes maxima]